MSERDREWRRFAELGDLIGMGEHLQEGGEWITKEYKALQRFLIPEIGEQERKQRRAFIDDQVKRATERDRCKCGGELRQTRGGSFVVKCVTCDRKYRYKEKRRK